mmetsp:Transcript_3475/g.3623  ORF Transcript_3475/g.3623 Transcript_3475/m.3623 type:complete len:158 (-) Transcript_3475:434-907(-)|eukprot:CAMPEP_0119038454 /NCGR_PEP_ID=MMETSP1177-20130426/7415_1 /TAXON_ID=2985 /ORGANISM="Ochromonas sp, Strain CCMP1899" /LENGTH=157 /DNA_ID=CAMNT_0007001091 /DNA_START=118 /DNA_END=591 /DNA_ORIENTATION=-
MSKIGKQVLRRFLTTPRSEFPRFEGAVRLFPMPQLSPHMAVGKVLKWHAKEGEMIPAYGLIADIRPDQLTDPLEKTLQDEKQSDMELELQEDMFIVKIICAEGEETKGGAPLAILCELEEDMNEAKNLKVASDANVYTDKEGIPMALWQAYLKGPSK